MNNLRRWLIALAGALVLVGVAPAVANAAVTGTVNQAVLQSPNGSDFTWSCDVNPDGQAIEVMGRSWNDPTNGVPGVDTARVILSGTTTQNVTFSRDGVESQAYGARCLWYLPGSSTVLGKTPTATFITTGIDNDPPNAVLTQPDPVDEDVSATLTAVDSTDPDDGIATYDWNYGDGTSSQNHAWWFVDHTYADPGIYTITVTVRDNGGLTDTDSKQIVVNDVVERPDFGSNANGVWRSTYDPIKVQRVFSGPTLPTWGSGALADPITTVLSTKPNVQQVNAGTLDSSWATWAATFPTNRKIHIVVWHEPEDQVYVTHAFTAAEFRAANIRLRGIVMANKPAAADVSWDVVLMSATRSTAGRDWRDFWPDDDAVFTNGSPYVQTLSWDNYWGSTDDGASAPSQDVFDRFGTGGLRDIYAVNDLVNTPIGVGEWGYDHDATRVGILNQIEQWALYGPGPGGGVAPSSSDRPPVSVSYICYFDTDGANATTGDHDLDRTDGADRNRWAEIVAA